MYLILILGWYIRTCFDPSGKKHTRVARANFCDRSESGLRGTHHDIFVLQRPVFPPTMVNLNLMPAPTQWMGSPVHPLLWWSHPSKSCVWVVISENEGGKLPFPSHCILFSGWIGQFFLKPIGEKTFAQAKMPYYSCNTYKIMCKGWGRAISPPHYHH